MIDNPVQAQLDAYNRRDIDGFLAAYADDAVIRHADGRVLMSGYAEMRPRYEKLFADHPNSSARVPRRIELGTWTVDEEYVTTADGELHAVVGYEVRDGLIRSVVMIRGDI